MKGSVRTQHWSCPYGVSSPHDDSAVAEQCFTADGNTAASSDAEKSIDGDDDTVHDVCGQCGHVVQTSKRPVELGSISDYDCFDPQTVVRPANVICKNGKPIYIIYDDDEVSGMDLKEEPAIEDLKRRAVMTEDTMEVEDLLLEMVEEFEEARPEHGGVDRRGAPVSAGGGGGIGVKVASRGAPGAGASSSTRGPAEAQSRAQAARERELVLEDLKRRAVMAEDTLELEDLLREMLEEFEAAPGSGGGIGVKAAAHGAPGAGASSSTRGLAGALDAARERERAAALEEMERRAAARRETDRELAREAAASVEALEAALQGWREASRQVTRRVAAEYGAPPAQAQERAGQRGEGSPAVDVTFSAMVYLLVCLASICFSSLRSQ